MSVARAPKMPKYSGSTTRRAPARGRLPISGSACARFAATSPPDTVCTAATRNVAASPVIASMPRGRLPGVRTGATLAVAALPRVTTGSDQLPVTV